MRGILLVAILGAFACGKSAEAPEPVSLESAVATGAPAVTAWARILLANTGIEVQPLHGAPGSPADRLPDREQLRAAQRARLIVLNGAGFESWAGQAALPPSRTHRSTRGLEARFLETEERTHAHGGQGEHTHPALDGRTWLDPALEVAQCLALTSLLEKEFAEQAQAIRANADAWNETALEAMAAMESTFASLKQARVLAIEGHGYGYLARAWNGEPAELELALDAKLGASDWNRVRSLLQNEGGILLCHEEPSPALRAQLAEEMKLVCVYFPTGEAPVEDWLQQQADAREALRQGVAALIELRAAE